MTDTPTRVMRSPRTLDLEITADCNLRCRYCYFFNNPGVVYQDLSTEEWLSFFDELGQLGVMDVSLAGGEPFARKDFKQLLEGIVRNRMRFAILTNGGLVTDEMAEFIASTGRCKYAQVSVDGSHPETHDVFRGKGAFEGAIRGLKILMRHGILTTARITIHSKNVDDLEATVRMLLDEIGLPFISTNAAGYLGNCRRNSDEVQIDTGEMMAAMKTLARLDQEYPDRLIANAGPMANYRDWTEMELARREETPSSRRGGSLFGCGCTYDQLAVRADGTIVPCVMLTHLPLGHVNQDRLSDIWLHHPTLEKMRQRNYIPLSSFEDCAACGYREYCTGNCPALAYTLSGDINLPAPDSCLRLFLKDGGRLDWMERPASKDGEEVQ